MSEYEGLQLEGQALKEQLIHCLEELASREREVSELHETSLKYHTKMQTYADQVRLLYREYAGAVDYWKVEKNTLEKRVRRARGRGGRAGSVGGHARQAGTMSSLLLHMRASGTDG
jgi:hypothetical protein